MLKWRHQLKSKAPPEVHALNRIFGHFILEYYLREFVNKLRLHILSIPANMTALDHIDVPLIGWRVLVYCHKGVEGPEVGKRHPCYDFFPPVDACIFLLHFPYVNIGYQTFRQSNLYRVSFLALIYITPPLQPHIGSFFKIIVKLFKHVNYILHCLTL
jgi:hypothetical protein